jgi:hypothetical protein
MEKISTHFLKKKVKPDDLENKKTRHTRFHEYAFIHLDVDQRQRRR